MRSVLDKRTPRKLPTAEDFRRVLRQLLIDAAAEGRTSIRIQAGRLHRMVGGYPGADHRMLTCCEVMRSMMGPGDPETESVPRGKGASLLVEYQLVGRKIAK